MFCASRFPSHSFPAKTLPDMLGEPEQRNGKTVSAIFTSPRYSLTTTLRQLYDPPLGDPFL